MKKKLLILSTVLFLFSCEAIFEDDLSNETVMLLAPKNNSELVEGKIQFHWQKLSDSLVYKIQIATPNFTNARQIMLDSTISTTSISKNLGVGVYEWRVRASNSAYTTAYSTSAFKVN